MKGLFHVPHSSKNIPNEYLSFFCLSAEDLQTEILKMTDHFTDELFDIPLPKFDKLKFPVSRLLVDPERFVSDNNEVMASVGMGCIYERTHNGEKLKEVSEIRDELISRYYQPHHETFTNMVDECIKLDSKCLIVDCHSFPKKPLPYELNQEPDRAEICIGTDSFHTPRELTEYFFTAFSDAGYSVSIDTPFSGSIVPLKFYQNEKRVQSVMIEVRRDLYMNEETGQKTNNFIIIKNTVRNVISEIVRKY